MNIESFATEVSNGLPIYELRAFIILILFLGSIPLTISFNRIKKKSLRVFLGISLLGIYKVSLIALTIIYGLNRDFFLNNLLVTVPMILILLLYILKLIGILFIDEKKVLTPTRVSLIPILIYTIFLLTISLLARPYITSNTVLTDNVLNSAGEIELTFSVPIRKNDIQIHISPEADAQYIYTSFIGLNEWATSVSILPEKSFLPNQKIVIYTTGLQSILSGGKVHEQSIDYFTPQEPEIKGVSVEDGATDVPITNEIVLELEGIDQKFVEWDIKFEPFVTYTLLREDPKKLILRPEGLKQGSQYTLQVIKTIVQYDTKTNEELNRLQPEVEKEISFTTIYPPGVTGFNRQNGILSNKEPLSIDFEAQIDPENFQEYFTISPQLDGTLTLANSNKQLVFTPNTPFSRNTEYVTTIKKGLRNIQGGFIEEDIILKFKTPGEVSVTTINPKNNTTGQPINTKQINISFNQPVDHSSAQSKFTISPSVKGNFSWSGDTMYYKFDSSLSYSTKYIVSIEPGVKSLYGIDSTKKYSYSFNTQNETILLNVPLYYQSESFTCNLAAAKMVLSYKGISISESSARESIGIGGDPSNSWVEMYGTHWGPLSSYLSSKGVTNSVKRGWNLTEALKEVKAGHPVLLYVYNGYTQSKGAFTLPEGATGYKGMHSEVLVGFVGKPENPVQVITNDPWRGKRYLSPSSFKAAWSYLNYTGIVIY